VAVSARARRRTARMSRCGGSLGWTISCRSRSP
jgi:hypothetical protein